MTNFIKKSEIKNNWILIDGENAVVGRLASYISKVLRGKNKSQYTPHMDTGDFVVIAPAAVAPPNKVVGGWECVKNNPLVGFTRSTARTHTHGHACTHTRACRSARWRLYSQWSYQAR